MSIKTQVQLNSSSTRARLSKYCSFLLFLPLSLSVISWQAQNQFTRILDIRSITFIPAFALGSGYILQTHVTSQDLSRSPKPRFLSKVFPAYSILVFPWLVDNLVMQEQYSRKSETHVLPCCLFWLPNKCNLESRYWDNVIICSIYFAGKWLTAVEAHYEQIIQAISLLPCLEVILVLNLH